LLLVAAVASAAALCPVPLAGAENAAALTARATKLYRAKQYDEACPLFEQVTAFAPRSAAAWADLGLCLGKLEGRAADAVAANRQAIALGGGNAKIRKAAMFNLAKLAGAELSSHVPGPTEDPLRDLEGITARCEIYDPAPGCSKPVWGCFSPDIRGDLVRLALDPRKVVDKKFPTLEPIVDPDDEPEPLLDGGAVVRSMRYLTVASTDSCDHLEVECRVVWADACAARAGVACTSQWTEGAEEGYEAEACPEPEVLVREIVLR
jgi:hypothetical protein